MPDSSLPSSYNEKKQDLGRMSPPDKDEKIGKDQNFEKYNEEATKFGLYHIFLILVIWWGNITMVGNVVFMVFGGAEKTNCPNSTVENKTYIFQNTSINPVVNQTYINSTTICLDKEYVFYSMIPEYGLSGADDYVINLITSIQLAGALIGALLGGVIADKFGRKLNTLLWIIGMAIFTSLSVLAPNWPVQLVFRLLIGIATGGYLSSGTILIMEWMNAHTRLPVQLTLDGIQSVGFMYTALMAYLSRHWKTLSLIIGLQGVPLALIFWFVLDPPVWLHRKGKFHKLVSTLKTVGKWNGKKDLKYADENAFFKPEKIKNDTTYLDLFGSRKLIQYSLMNIYSFFVCGTVAYLLIFNVGNLVGDIFLNFALLGAVNIGSAVVTFFAQHIFALGRRPIHQAGLNGVWICLGIIVVWYLLGSSVQENYSEVLVVFALLGSVFSFPLWTICNLYSGELYPTRMRNKGNGIGGFAANLGGIIAPIILYLFKVWKPSPFIIGGSLTLANVVLAFLFLPETRGKFQEAGESDDDVSVDTEESVFDEKF